MVQIFVEGCDRLVTLRIPESDEVENFSHGDLAEAIASSFGISVASFYVTTKGGKPLSSTGDVALLDNSTLSLKLRLCGGIDFQHREGSKIGGGGKISILAILLHRVTLEPSVHRSAIIEYLYEE